MRKIILATLLLATIIFLFANRGELENVVQTLQRGDWRWLGLAIAVQVAWVVNVAAAFHALYRLLGVGEKIERLIPVAAAANFVNVVAPSMGMGGLAVFVIDGRRRKLPGGRVATAVALFVLYDYLAFLVVLGLGLAVLVRRNQLGPGEVIASGIFIATAVVMGTLILLGMRSPGQFERALSWLGGGVNAALRPLLRRDYFDLDRAHTFAAEITEGLQVARRSPEGLILPFGLAMSSKALLISVLFLVFLAFRQPFSVGTLIAGFSIGYLFMIVSPTPAGIGVVEGALAIGLNSLRVPLGAATVIALAYRGITFWLPLVYGMFAFRWVSRGAEQPAGLHPS